MYRTLVSVKALQDNLFNATWCVVDCRHDLGDFAAGFAAYQAGHIPNATFAHIEEDLSGEKTAHDGRHPLPRREDLAAIFEEWGISDDTQIVAYDAQGGQFASRLWWLARWLGHEAVAVLDGGWPAWLAQTGWPSTEDADRVPGKFTPRAPLEQTVDAGAVLANARGDDHLLVDARAAERFEGRVEPIDPVAGHVPGAVNRFWQANLSAPNGAFKPAAQLRAEYEALLGGRAPDQVVQMCGSGISAAHNLLAMQHAGLHGARLYAGSWSEWIRDPARPVATGA
jgi:thiosulfate/3-mercaptopyruvate sulfurtransferase